MTLFYGLERLTTIDDWRGGSWDDTGPESGDERVLRFDPTNAYAWETAYVVHYRRNELERAEAAARKMVDLRPTAEGFVRLWGLGVQTWAERQGTRGQHS